MYNCTCRHAVKGEKPMDYKALLQKYITFIGTSSGDTWIASREARYHFTKDELVVLDSMNALTDTHGF